MNRLADKLWREDPDNSRSEALFRAAIDAGSPWAMYNFSTYYKDRITDAEYENLLRRASEDRHVWKAKSALIHLLSASCNSETELFIIKDMRNRLIEQLKQSPESMRNEATASADNCIALCEQKLLLDKYRKGFLAVGALTNEKPHCNMSGHID